MWLLSGFGWLGLHRFYLRKPITGAIWALTGGLAGLGSIYDLFTLGKQVDRANMEALLYGGGNVFFVQQGETRRVNDGGARIVRDKEKPEQTVLHIAKRNKGVVSAADFSLETGLSLDEAKKTLEGMAKKGYVEMRVRSNGSIVFTINDFFEDDGSYEA